MKNQENKLNRIYNGTGHQIVIIDSPEFRGRGIDFKLTKDAVRTDIVIDRNDPLNVRNLKVDSIKVNDIKIFEPYTCRLKYDYKAIEKLSNELAEKYDIIIVSNTYAEYIKMAILSEFKYKNGSLSGVLLSTNYFGLDSKFISKLYVPYGSVKNEEGTKIGCLGLQKVIILENFYIGYNNWINNEKKIDISMLSEEDIILVIREFVRDRKEFFNNSYYNGMTMTEGIKNMDDCYMEFIEYLIEEKQLDFTVGELMSI